MSETDIVAVVRKLPRIPAVRAIGATRVRVTWSRGGEQDVDLSPIIERYRLYAPLRSDPDLFGSVHVGHDGSCIAWGDDNAIDMSATSIERLSETAPLGREPAQAEG